VFVTSAIAAISVGVQLTAVNSWAAAKSSQPFRTDVSGTKSPVRRASSTAMTLATTTTDDRAERTFSRAPGRDVSANKQV
jgi:phosphohistidine phosphatase SixA